MHEFNSPTMTIQRIEELFIDIPTREAIHSLLEDSFPDYPQGQTYYKQLPDFRYLAWEAQELIGHMAIEHRLINNDGQILRIFGIADLCVAKSFQRQRIATKLIQQLLELSQTIGIDFILLIAEEDTFYHQIGFHPVQNNCQWVLIHRHETFGVVQRRMDSGLMIKGVSEKNWRNGKVDFLGHVF